MEKSPKGLLILEFPGLERYLNNSSRIRREKNSRDEQGYKNCSTLIYGEYEEPVNILALGFFRYNSKSPEDVKNFVDRALNEYNKLTTKYEEVKIMFGIHSFGAYFAGNVIKELNKRFDEKEHESKENKVLCQFYNNISRLFLNQPFISNKWRDIKGKSKIFLLLSFTRKINQEAYKKLLLNKKDDHEFKLDFFLCAQDEIINYQSQKSFFESLKDVENGAGVKLSNAISINETAKSHNQINQEQQDIIEDFFTTQESSNGYRNTELNKYLAPSESSFSVNSIDVDEDIDLDLDIDIVNAIDVDEDIDIGNENHELKNNLSHLVSALKPKFMSQLNKKLELSENTVN